MSPKHSPEGTPRTPERRPRSSSMTHRGTFEPRSPRELAARIEQREADASVRVAAAREVDNFQVTQSGALAQYRIDSQSPDAASSSEMPRPEGKAVSKGPVRKSAKADEGDLDLSPPKGVRDLKIIVDAENLLARLTEIPEGGTPGQNSENSSGEPSPESKITARDVPDSPASIITQLIDELKMARKMYQEKCDIDFKYRQESVKKIKYTQSNFLGIQEALSKEQEDHDQCLKHYFLAMDEISELQKKGN